MAGIQLTLSLNIPESRVLTVRLLGSSRPQSLCKTEQTLGGGMNYGKTVLVPGETMPDSLICAICKQPVNLEESKTDEHGHAVHENCYIWTIELRKPRRSITQIDAHRASPMS
jgi:hypothetical protein